MLLLLESKCFHTKICDEWQYPRNKNNQGDVVIRYTRIEFRHY